MKFKSRRDAGKQLSSLVHLNKKDQYIGLGLARGGVPIAYEIAHNLNIPFYPIIVRKIGSPFNKEFGVGAITEDNVKVLDTQVLQELNLSEEELKDIILSEEKELKRRRLLYRNDQKLPSLENKVVILVDDGMATGITMKAVINRVKKENPKKIIVLVPVCSRETKNDIEKDVDQLISIYYPKEFDSVGQWYEEFPQVSDNEVLSMVNS